MEQMASIDFFVVPTATFRVLFVFVVLSHARRRVLHFQVTDHPSQEWTMQQLREAFPWDHGCRYLLRDRDAIYGGDLVAMTKGLGMEEVITAPLSPWQNPYVERLIGSVRRECLDHVIVWNERSLRRTLRSYFAYYQRSRNPFGVGQGRSGVEDRGEARIRAHRRDSSTWRTPSPIPTARRLGIVLRCPGLWLPISCRGLAKHRRVFASQDRISSRPTNCSLHSLLCDPEHVSSLPEGRLHQPLRQGWSCTDEVFSNDTTEGNSMYNAVCLEVQNGNAGLGCMRS